MNPTLSSCPDVRELFRARGAHQGHIGGCVRCQSAVRLGFQRTLASSKCAEIEPLLAERVLGQLGPDAEEQLMAHLEGCASCLAVAGELDRNPVGEALLDLGVVAIDDFKDLKMVEPENYVRGGEIGRGGMGRIVRARDRRLGRAVVIKELLDERQRDRFEHEARLTARLQHPAIVNVHEAGRWPNGEPFYVMKYVAGRPLDAVVEATRSLDERLALLPNLITVVEAVAYAHSVKVIHRDLKPPNILVGAFGETVVIDWGLAKDLSEAAASSEDGGPYRGDGLNVTQGGAGTPQYMPPEQLAGHLPDERLDVYALGATLYHVLAGAAPYGEMPLGAVLERVRSDGPPPLHEIEPRVPRALQAIVAKAMARDPADRYATAGELAEDLKRFQSGQLVAAHHYTLAERAGRFYGRHRAVVTLAAVSLACLAAVGAVSVNNVVQAKRRAEAQLGQLLLERGQREVVAGAPSAALVYLREAVRRGIDSPALRFLVAEAVRSVGGQVESYSVADRGLVAARFSPDGARLATSSDAGVRVWEAGRLIATLSPRSASTLLFGKAGRRLLTGDLCEPTRVDAGRCDPGLELWDAATGQRVAVLPHPSPVTEARFTNRDRVVTVAGDQTFVWDGTDGHPVTDVLYAAADSIPIAEDGTSATFGRLRFEHGAAIAETRLSDDRHALATIGADGVVRVWNAANGVAVGSFDGQGAPLLDAALSPDGGLLSTVTVDGQVRRWRSGQRALRVGSGGAPLSQAVFGPDGNLLIVDQDGIVLVTDPSGATVGSTLLPAGAGGSAVFRADGHILLDDGAGAQRDWKPGSESTPIAVPTPHAAVAGRHLTASDDGTRVLGIVDGEPPAATVWDAATGAKLAEVPVGYAPTMARADLVLAPRGDRLAVLAGDRHVDVWSLTPRAKLGTIALDGPVSDVRWSSDGGRLLVVASDARVWSVAGEPLVTLRAPVGLLTTAVFSRDDERILAGARSGVAELFDAASGELLTSLGPFGGPIDRVAFDAGGARAVVAAGATYALWSVGAERHDAAELDRVVADLPFRFDGVRVQPRAVRADRPDPPSVARARAHFTAGSELVADRRYADAEAQFRAAYREMPWPGYQRFAAQAHDARTDRPTGDEVTMHMYFDRGRDLYESRAYEQAALEFLKAYRAQPHASFLFNAAVCYEKVHDTKQAIEYFTSYLEKQPMAKDRAETEARLARLRAAQ